MSLSHYRMRILAPCLILSGILFASTLVAQEPVHVEMEIFPPQELHVHASSVVELPNGDLLAGWFEGTGERTADDVVIKGARLVQGADRWSEPFLLVDVPGFPDFTPLFIIDAQERLWMFWYTVLAHQWETSMLKYRISSDYMQPEGPPKWEWQEVVHMKPGGDAPRGIQPDDPFVQAVDQKLKEYIAYLKSKNALPDDAESMARVDARVERILANARGENMIRAGQIQREDGSSEEVQLGYPYFRRMGWQTKNKPVIIDGERMIVPLYSDGFSFSLMAITDDWGATWQFSEPIVGFGNIQPSIAVKRDGTLVAYMRDNGPPPKRLHVSESSDRGMTWSGVQDSDLPNPGSGADVVTLENGNWLLVYNDTEQGRHSLAASLSTDEGQSWSHTRHIELDTSPEHRASSHYPTVIQGSDGTIHLSYTQGETRPAPTADNPDAREPARTIKYVRFNEAWVREGGQVNAQTASESPAGLDVPYARRQDTHKADMETPPGSSHVASLEEAANGDLLFSFGADAPLRGHENWRPWTYLTRMAKGTDTFSEPVRLDRDSPYEVHNAVLWHNGAGRIFCFYTTQEGENHTFSTLDLMTSDDHGHTWSAPRVMREEHGLMFGTRPFRMSNGEAILPVYIERYPRGVGFFISDDDFETWEVYPKEEPWPGAHPTWTDSPRAPGTGISPGGLQASVVELAEPGHLLAYMRTNTPNTWQTRSTDYGRTWSVAEPTEFISSARVALLRLDNGHLVFAHNPTRSSPRSPLELRLSEDEGKTWPYSVEVETDRTLRFDYPYLIQTSDGMIHLGYTHRRQNMRHVVFNEAFIRNGEHLPSDEDYSILEYKGGEFTKILK